MKDETLYPVKCLNCWEIAFNFTHELQDGDNVYLEYIKERHIHCNNCHCPVSSIYKSKCNKGKFWAIPQEEVAFMFPDPEIKRSRLN